MLSTKPETVITRRRYMNYVLIMFASLQRFLQQYHNSMIDNNIQDVLASLESFMSAAASLLANKY
jgi:hypothetical protein